MSEKKESIITLARMEASLIFLAETDEECGKLRADHARAEFKAKSVYNAIFNSLDGSAATRKPLAEVHPKYVEAKNAEFDAFFAYEAMKNTRSTKLIVIEAWRSINSARNKGQII